MTSCVLFVRRAKAAKARGVSLFTAGRHRAALRSYDVAIRLLTAPFAPLDMSKIEMPTADPATVRFFVFAYGRLD